MTTSRRYTVTQGLSPKPGDPWFTAEVKLNGSLRRINSDFLPLELARHDAEYNLVHWLWVRNTTPVQRREESFGEWLTRKLDSVQGMVTGIDVERFL